MNRKDLEQHGPSAEPERETGEEFLRRWSRRKAEVREQARRPAPEPQPSATTSTSEPEPQSPPLSDADMPALDSLTETSDVSGFFSPGVSEKLRRLALRKVFSLATYNVRDGLDDYDDDFTVFEPLGDTVTADMRHRQEREAERREREAAQARAAETDQDTAAEDGAEQQEDEATDTQSARAPATQQTTHEAAGDDNEDGPAPDEGAKTDA